VGGARAKTSVFTVILHTAQKKTFHCKPAVLMDSVHSEDVKNPRWGNLKPAKNFGCKIFISSILSDVGKFAQLNGTIGFQLREKKISPENRFCSLAVLYLLLLLWRILSITYKMAPCGLRGCKNRPAPFPGRMSYNATKPIVLFYML